MTGSAAGACAVLGAGPGLGAALARRFGREGHPVGVVARSRAALAALCSELAAMGIDGRPFPTDLARPAGVPATMEAMAERLGPIEVLCYNAARLGMQARPSELDVGALEDSLRVNLLSAVAASQAVIPAMRARGRGSILLTSGTFAVAPSAPFAAISMGKAALRSLALTLDEEVAPDGIHVATVVIGGVIERGGPHDPDRLADQFWQLHQQPPGEFVTEVRV